MIVPFRVWNEEMKDVLGCRLGKQLTTIVVHLLPFNMNLAFLQNSNQFLTKAHMIRNICLYVYGNIHTYISAKHQCCCACAYIAIDSRVTHTCWDETSGVIQWNLAYRLYWRTKLHPTYKSLNSDIFSCSITDCIVNILACFNFACIW